jgi:hypothetical protein
LLLAICWIGGCKVRSEDFTRPVSVPRVDLGAATPPPAPSPAGEKLFQVLYAGEVGEAATAAGQRVRVRAWLDVLDLDAAEREGLRVLAREVRAMVEAERQARARLDGYELAAYTSIYRELEARLAEDAPLGEAEAAAFAARLEAARAAVYAGEDPRAAQLARVRAVLDAAAPWIASLPYEKQQRIASSRFFLQKRANPLLAPADYQALVGMNWDGGDFSAVAATEPPSGQSHMDVGGLWSVEHVRAPPDGYLVKRQLQAVLVMALLEPALVDVLGDGAVVATD